MQATQEQVQQLILVECDWLAQECLNGINWRAALKRPFHEWLAWYNPARRFDRPDPFHMRERLELTLKFGILEKMASHIVPDRIDEVTRDEIQSLINHECSTLAEMLIQKNRSYGNSALMPIRFFSSLGWQSGLYVRMDDKVSRILNSPDSYSEDPVNDLLGYGILVRVGLRLQASDSSDSQESLRIAATERDEILSQMEPFHPRPPLVHPMIPRPEDCFPCVEYHTSTDNVSDSCPENLNP